MKNDREKNAYRLCQISWCLILLFLAFGIRLRQMEIFPEAIPVSYTHLDVYKRQFL